MQFAAGVQLTKKYFSSVKTVTFHANCRVIYGLVAPRLQVSSPGRRSSSGVAKLRGALQLSREARETLALVLPLGSGAKSHPPRFLLFFCVFR